MYISSMVSVPGCAKLESVESLRERGVTFSGEGFVRSPLPVSDLAARSFSMLALAVADLLTHLGFAGNSDVRVDRELCDAWFGLQYRPVGWEAPSPWDPLSGAFSTRDNSWIRTHANAPRHRQALLAVLGCDPDAGVDAVSRAIRSWRATELEEAVIGAGGVAAAFRSPDEWSASHAGKAVSAEPLVESVEGEEFGGPTRWEPTPQKPLAGLRVLDLTRVIAGPACTQVLAGLGADVLRIDPLDWDEPAVLPLVMWGKRSARLNATSPRGRDQLAKLLAGADVLVHGYRAGAIDGLGLSAQNLRRIRPGLIDVGERAYGWSGPWAGRRGFDSIVQFATGIAHAGMTGTQSTKPVSLPVQALDWATGYLAATAVIAGLAHRIEAGRGSSWQLSLARTAHALLSVPVSGEAESHAEAPQGMPGRVLDTSLGPAFLASSPIRVGSASLTFEHVTTKLGRDSARWL